MADEPAVADGPALWASGGPAVTDGLVVAPASIGAVAATHHSSAGTSIARCCSLSVAPPDSLLITYYYYFVHAEAPDAWYEYM